MDLDLARAERGGNDQYVTALTWTPEETRKDMEN